MPKVLPCLDVNELEEFALGKTRPREAEQIEQHLSQCSRCAETMAALVVEDTLSTTMREQAALESDPDQHVVEELIQRLENLTAGSASSSAETLAPRGADAEAGMPAVDENTQEMYDFLTPPRAPGEIGYLGQYRVLKLLGAGGMGVVFLAEDPQLKRKVALKAMKPSVAVNASFRKRFLREAQMVAALTHDHIVAIHQVGEDRSVPFLVMPFLQGETLEDRFRSERPIGLTEILRFGREIAEGLGAAHERGLIHRDIKPGNIWLEQPSARVKILDFGLARDQEANDQISHSGVILGTPAYMSPEQARTEELDCRSDLFSLGCVMYRACTGQAPFVGKDVFTVLLAVTHEQPKTPAELNPALPGELSDLVMHLLEKDPARRVGSAAEVIEALKKLEQQAMSAAITSQPMDGRKRVARAEETNADTATIARLLTLPARSKRTAIMFAVGVFLVLLGGVLAYQLVFQTPNGTLIVEVDGDADVRFQKGELRIHDADGKLLYTLKPSEKNKTLPPGKYLIEVAGVDGLKLTTDRFEITRKGRAEVRVTLAPVAIADKGTAEKGPLDKGPPVKVYTNSVGIKFAFVPRGTFWKGGGGGKPGVLQVEIPEDFYLGIFPVTQGQWTELMGDNPSYYSRKGKGNDDVAKISDTDLALFPVEQVSWKDAQEFIRKLNEREKGKSVYRLPNENEWEYACRGAASSREECSFDFYFEESTNEVKLGQANINNVLGRTSKVGSYKPNRLGLYDMHGNVWQWCEDWFEGGDHKVHRGGTWNHLVGTSFRGRSLPSNRTSNLGFRLVAAPVRNDLSPADAAGNAFQKLLSRETDPKIDRKELRLETLAFLKKHPGTPHALKAASLLSRLPSPLDAFTRENMSPYELAVSGNGDSAKAPAGLVAVLGDSRLRHWARGARASFSPDSKMIASLAYDGVVKLWETDTGNELATLPASFAHPHVPAFSPDGKTLAATTSDGWVTLWDVATKKEKRIFPIRSKGGAISLTFHPKKKVLAIASVDGLVKLFSTETGDELRTLDFTGASINMMAFSPDGEFIAATNNWAGIVRIWQTESGEPLHTLEGKHGAIPCLAFSPDGKTLATAGDNFIKWWDPHTGKQLKSIRGHANRIWGLAYSPNGEKLATGSWDGAIKVWNAKTGKQEQSMSSPAPILSMAFHQDNTTIGTGDHDGTIRLWDSTTGKELQTRPVTFLFSLAFRADGEFLMVGGASSSKMASLQWWPMVPGKAARTMPVAQVGCIISVACSPDGRTLAAGGEDGTVQLWDLASDTVFATIKGSGGRVLSVAFSPDGKWLAIGCDNPGVLLCDAVKGEAWVRLNGHAGLVSAVAFSPDSKTLASASDDKTVILWDVDSGKKKEALTGQTGAVHCVAFSPDGKELAHGSDADKTVNLWDLSTGKVRQTLEGFASCVAYSPDGRLLASVGEGKVCVRDAASGKTLQTYRVGPPGGTITRIAFSPDGRYLATANWNSTVHILRVADLKNLSK